MGNYQTTDVYDDVGGLITSKYLDLSKKLTPDDYKKHISGECLEGSLQSIPLDIIYYDAISMFEEINFSFNFIAYIPEEFSLRVPHLQYLNVSHNQLSGLPFSFHLLLHLRVLDLSFNKVAAFPEALVHLRSLDTLNISHNELPDLPTSVRKMIKLKRLNVSHNHLRALPESLLECPNLELIVTLGNSLIHPPQAICDEGSDATLQYLAQKRIPSRDMSTQVLPPSSKVFSRIRGQQVMASVANPDSASREYRQAQGMSRTNKRKCPLMVPPNATQLAPDQLRESILGLVLGACIGDALGLNTEGLSKDECQFFYFNDSLSLSDRLADLLRSHFPPNDWSSNVDLMLLTLESLMRWGGVVDELELASQMMQWMVHGLTELDPFPGFPLSPLLRMVIGSEGYVAHPHAVAASQYHKLVEEHKRGLNLNINLNDNSCLPAAVVLGIPNFYKVNEVTMNAERICRATHSSPSAVAASIFTALVAAYLLQGKLLNKNLLENELSEIRDVALQSLTNDESKEEFQKLFDDGVGAPSNDVALTLKFIISALRSTSQSFEEILSSYVLLGGEGIAAHCCVVGGILGAYFGYSKIPDNLLDQLPKENKQWLNTKLNHLLDLFSLP